MKVQRAIEEKLRNHLKISYLEVVNESHSHNVPAGSETHFKVLAVSMDFDGLSRLERHRKVNEILRGELAGSVHALTLRLLTPDEWSREPEKAFQSPPCHGGGKK